MSPRKGTGIPTLSACARDAALVSELGPGRSRGYCLRRAFRRSGRLPRGPALITDGSATCVLAGPPAQPRPPQRDRRSARTHHARRPHVAVFDAVAFQRLPARPARLDGPPKLFDVATARHLPRLSPGRSPEAGRPRRPQAEIVLHLGNGASVSAVRSDAADRRPWA